MQIMEFKFSG